MLKALSVAVSLAATCTSAALAQTAPPAPGPADATPHHMHHQHMQQMHHQQMHGGPGHGGHETAAGPTMAGQDAFGALAEVVRMLDADPRTDWSRVDLERLRQHLIDMNEVVLRSSVAQSPVPGGLAMEITGTGRTVQAIRAMVVPHAAELDALPGLAARSEAVEGGVRLTVTSRQPDERAAARLRALGFAGLLTLGSHHGPHHLAMARGEAVGPHKP